MNFTCYDNVNKPLDKTKSWINIKYKQIFSNEIKYNKYYQLIKRFDVENRLVEYFVAFMNDKDEDNKSCRIDDYGRTRFSISSIWNETGCNKLTTDTQIKIEYIESINNADIFKLNF